MTEKLLYAHPEHRPHFDFVQISQINTLGPEGTSSHEAARGFASNYALHGAVALFDTYEEAQNVTAKHANHVLLVANAYQHINRIYICSELTPFAAFFQDTPEYGIASLTPIEEMAASRPDVGVQISTHPAPQHLIQRLMKGSDYDVVVANSTSHAAKMVVDRDTDACLTNETCRELYELSFVSSTISFRMLWTLFCRREVKTTYANRRRGHGA